jgi:AcrR family transcriptional regulator
MVQPGLRERKKQRTRQALVEAAVRLFEERGYDQTTVADIAAAAEVSTRTFFLHFPTKEAVVFANSAARLDLGLEIIAGRRAGLSPRRAVLRAMEQMVNETARSDLTTGLGQLRTRLLMSTPTVREALFRRLLPAQDSLIQAIQHAYSFELDIIDVAAIAGAMVGAVYAAALQSTRRGDTAAEIQQAMLRAARVAAKCLPADQRDRRHSGN